MLKKNINFEMSYGPCKCISSKVNLQYFVLQLGKKCYQSFFFSMLNLHVCKCSEKKTYQNLTLGKGQGQGHLRSKHVFFLDNTQTI